MVGKTKDDLIIRLTVDGNVIVSDDGALSLKFGLYTGLNKPDMGGQFYEGEIIMKSNDMYCFTYTIVSDKEIILAEPETCPLEQN